MTEMKEQKYFLLFDWNWQQLKSSSPWYYVENIEDAYYLLNNTRSNSAILIFGWIYLWNKDKLDIEWYQYFKN